MFVGAFGPHGHRDFVETQFLLYQIYELKFIINIM